MVVELVDGAKQTEVSLLDEVEEGHAASEVLLGNADHKSQVGGGEEVLGVVVARLDALRVQHLLLLGEQSHLTDLAEVHADRVVERHGGADVDEGGRVLLLVGVLDALAGDGDAELAEGVEEALESVRLELHVRESADDVVSGELTVLLAADDERLCGHHQGVHHPRGARWRQRRCRHACSRTGPSCAKRRPPST